MNTEMTMRNYVGQTWVCVRDPLGSVYEDIELSRCAFQGCSLGEQARHASHRTVVRHVRATNCKIDGGSVGPVLFEDVDICNLRTVGHGVWVWGALFKHVALSGKMGNISLSHSRWGPATMTDEMRAGEASFAASAEVFYASIDWALDISRAEFRELDWRLNLPSRLVRRDPGTQIVVKRERLLDGAWQKLPLYPAISIALSNFVDFNLPERILAAPKASKSFKDELASIELLRKEGIAEPD